ncbi:Hypothetical protein CINCED_3A001654 [Cinara cedri]|nr:Hypothetical protein CINCED_3A001654 [Cinara cedri]
MAKKKGSKRTIFKPFEEKNIPHITHERAKSGSNEIQHKDNQINSQQNNIVLDSQHFPSLVVKKQKDQAIH